MDQLRTVSNLLNSMCHFFKQKNQGNNIVSLYPGLETLQGRKVKIVSVPYFPYMDYSRDTDVRLNVPVVAVDSLDTRIIGTLANKLNFT